MYGLGLLIEATWIHATIEIVFSCADPRRRFLLRFRGMQFSESDDRHAHRYRHTELPTVSIDLQTEHVYYEASC